MRRISGTKKRQLNAAFLAEPGKMIKRSNERIDQRCATAAQPAGTI
jgi:hypothetical protein